MRASRLSVAALAVAMLSPAAAVHAQFTPTGSVKEGRRHPTAIRALDGRGLAAERRALRPDRGERHFVDLQDFAEYRFDRVPGLLVLWHVERAE